MSRSRRESSPPSPQATQGLKDSLRVELGELSVRFEEAQLRSDALRRLGRDEAAVDALEESRELLRTYQTRVEQALSAAAVEREAEWVMAEAAHEQRLAALPMDADVIDLDEVRTRRQDRLRRIPATLSAAAASVLVLGMAVATLRAPRGGDDTTLAASALAEPDSGEFSPVDGRPRVSPSPLPPGYASEEEVLATINDDPVIGALLNRRRDLLSLLGETASTVTPALLEELEEITGRLVLEGVDETLLEWLDDFHANGPDAPGPADAEQPDDSAPEAPEGADDAPADAEQPEAEEPEADGESEDEGVFGGFGDDSEEPDSEGGAGAEGSGSDSSKSGDGEEEDGDSLLG